MELKQVGSKGRTVVGLSELGRMCQQMSPLGPGVPDPFWMRQNLQIEAGPPTAKPNIVHPKDGGPSGLEEL